MALKRIKITCIFLIFLFLISFSYSLTTLTVTEGDTVKLEIAAQDPDQDNVFLYYSSPLNDSGEWQTNLNDAGTYHTKVIASDGKSQTEEEIVIIVKNKNQPPEIGDKKFVVEETEIIELKQLISDPDNDTLKLIFEEPFDEEGVWQTTYDDAGTYQTEIIVSDLEYKTGQTIEIKIKNKNQIPEIISSFSESAAVQLTEDSTFQFSVSAQDQDKDTLTYSWQLNGKEISQESSFSHYFDFDAAGEHELILSVSDQESVAEELWILEVKNLNRPPELPEIIIKIDEGEKIILQLPETDMDGDVVTYSFQPPFEDGTWQTTYDDAGVHTTVITASDGNLTAEKEIEITINNVDRPPVINLDEKIIVDEGEELTMDLDDFVSDPDDDEIVINVESLPEGAVFSDNELKWQPDFDFIQRKSSFFTNLLNRLRIEQYLFFRNKNIDLLITACGKELCVEHILELQVNNVNKKPSLEKIEDITLTETETVFLKPFASDPDSDYIKYDFEKPFNSNGEWQTTYDDAGTHTVTVTVSDGYLTDTQEVKITVLNKNRSPTLEVGKDCFKLNENLPWSLKITAADPDHDNLTLWAEDLPKGASFKDQIFSWTPSFDTVKERKRNEQFIVNFIASDGEFDVVHPVTITVKNANRVPEIVGYSPTGDLIVKVNEPATFSVTADDADGDSLLYEWDFGFWDRTVKGPSTIKRTFKTPGMKAVKVNVGDGSSSVELEWTVKVNPLPVLVELVTPEEEEEVEEIVDEIPEEIKEETEEEPKFECPEPTSCPTPSCQERAPCPQPVIPPKAPFKVYVVSS